MSSSVSLHLGVRLQLFGCLKIRWFLICLPILLNLFSGGDVLMNCMNASVGCGSARRDRRSARDVQEVPPDDQGGRRVRNGASRAVVRRHRHPIRDEAQPVPAGARRRHGPSACALRSDPGQSAARGQVHASTEQSLSPFWFSVTRSFWACSFQTYLLLFESLSFVCFSLSRTSDSRSPRACRNCTRTRRSSTSSPPSST